jgi:putative glutamine amidotransferase
MLRIGISPCHALADYVTSVRDTGARAVVLDLTVAAEDLLKGIDALVLTGGGDVNPALYGAAPHPTYHPAEAGRDEAELALARGAIESGLPLLAICRGVQVLNVAAGGTLVQDIPSEVATPLNHQVKDPRDAIAHDVRVTPGSLTSRLLANHLTDDVMGVNSRHHQAVRLIAPGFQTAAVAPDGVIEGIELSAVPFSVGVQWHPENFHQRGTFRALFEGLLAAVRR